MRFRAFGGLALALGLLVPAVRADDGWQPAGANTGVRLGCPVPAASLAPPVPLKDASLRPVSFEDPADLPTIRAAGPDVGPSPSNPMGMTSANSGAMFQWHLPPSDTPTSAGPSRISNAGEPPLAGDGLGVHPTAAGDPVLTMPTPLPDTPANARAVPSWPMMESTVGDSSLCGCNVDGCCDNGCGCCPPGNRWYVSADYLLWWIRGQPLPPLVTTSTNPFLPNAGALGAPGTIVEYGGNTVNGGPYSGARLTTGWWCDPEHDLGFEVSGFFLGSRTAQFQDFSNAQTFLARPFFNVDTGLPDRQITSAPGVVAGGVVIDARTVLWGAEANIRSNLICGECGYIDVLTGFRTLGLNESLNLNETVGIVAGPFNGVSFNLLDQFRTSNQFYGGQVGAAGEWRIGRWSLDLTGKLGLGMTQQRVDITGGSSINNLGTVSVFPGNGILAAPTNDGHFTRDVFTVVPEIGFTLGYQVTEHFRLGLGYNFLYWSSVLRPGNQIDTALDPNQFATSNPTGTPTGAQHPAFVYYGSSFWAQGINVTAEFRW
jgi:hypothetical protein